jgi:hypothetical protein
MNKVYVQEDVAELDIDGMAVVELISLLEMLVDRSGDKIFIDIDRGWAPCSHDEINVIARRLESAPERKERLIRETARLSAINTRDEREYKRLKEKLER